MDSALPEEILREILWCNLSISHSDFLGYVRADCPGYRSGLDRNSHLLLVSKRWLRVGTPLLYECLQLHTQQQTASVANLLRAHPLVGLSVRCLRLEGGFGKDLVHVAKFTPKADAILFNPKIKSAHSIAGLKKAFLLFKPTTLYIHQHDYYRVNKNIVAARAVLHDCIRSEWPSLRSVYLPDYYRGSLAQEMTDALADSSVEEVVCDAWDVKDWIADGKMARILQNRTLKRVVCKGRRFEQTVRELLKQHGFPAQDMQKFSFRHVSSDEY